MKITKTTLILFKRYTNIYNKKYNPRLTLIVDILRDCGAICGNYKEGFEICEESNSYTSVISGDYKKSLARGMHSRYPDCIGTTLTYGNGEIQLLNVNKLVKNIVNE